MSFFNKKEDVLDIELTQFGREQMAKGGLKPTYYSFFDDNILYDTEYAGHTEDQNKAEPRIQEDTPTLKTQAIFEGAEYKSSDGVGGQGTIDKHYSMVNPLGTSALDSQYRPAWDVKFLNGTISGSLQYLTGSHQPLQIPQIDVDIVYKTIVKNIKDPIDTTVVSDDVFIGDSAVLRSSVFEDGTYLQIIQDPILIDIFESNTEFEAHNIDIEFFEVELVDVSGSIQNPGASASRKTKKEVLKPLQFRKKFSNIQNNLLLSDEEMPAIAILPQDPNYVEYYLDFLIDKEIPNNIICQAIQKLRSRGVDIDSAFMDFDCPDDQGGANGDSSSDRFNMYGSTVIDDGIEVCEDDTKCQD